MTKMINITSSLR